VGEDHVSAPFERQALEEGTEEGGVEDVDDVEDA
jgi:hypothetical protein